MTLLIYITEESSVRMVLQLVSRMKLRYGNQNFYCIAYTSTVKNKIKELDKEELFSKIFTQSDTNIEQNDPLSNEEKIKIASIEKDYSRETIWNYVYQDRHLTFTKSGFLFSYGSKHKRNTQLRTIIKRFIYVEKIFEDIKPDLLFYATHDYGTSIAAIAWEVASRIRLPIYVPNYAKYESNFILNTDIYGEFPEFSEQFAINYADKAFNINEETIDYLSKFQSNNKQAFYIDRSELQTPKVVGRRVLSFCKLLMLNKSKNKDHLRVSGLKIIKDKIIVSRRLNSLKNNNVFEAFDKKTKETFVLFPLHFEPELVLLLQSQPFLNQLNVIQHIARNLPNNVILYVKENPTSAGRRKLSYYEKIKSIPNVKLIGGDVNSIDVMKEALGVITIIGTSGIEAFLLGKPVITLSNTNYNFLPSIINCKNYNRLPSYVRGFSGYKLNRHEQLVFLQTLIDLSINVNLVELFKDVNDKGVTDRNEEDIDRYFDFICQYIDRTPSTSYRAENEPHKN